MSDGERRELKSLDIETVIRIVMGCVGTVFIESGVVVIGMMLGVIYLEIDGGAPFILYVIISLVCLVMGGLLLKNSFDAKSSMVHRYMTYITK